MCTWRLVLLALYLTTLFTQKITSSQFQTNYFLNSISNRLFFSDDVIPRNPRNFCLFGSLLIFFCQPFGIHCMAPLLRHVCIEPFWCATQDCDWKIAIAYLLVDWVCRHGLIIQVVTSKLDNIKYIEISYGIILDDHLPFNFVILMKSCSKPVYEY